MRITCRAKPSQETWNRTLDKEGAVRVAESALQEGVVFLTAEQYGNVVWLPVSFPITDGGLEEDPCILTRLVSELASVHYPVACAVPNDRPGTLWCSVRFKSRSGASAFLLPVLQRLAEDVGKFVRARLSGGDA